MDVPIVGSVLPGDFENHRHGIYNNSSSIGKFISDSVSDETSEVKSDNELLCCEFGLGGHATSHLGDVFQF